MTPPRFTVRSPAGDRTEHRTLLEAMKTARELVQAGRRGVAVEDHRASIVWRATRRRSGRPRADGEQRRQKARARPRTWRASKPKPKWARGGGPA